MRAVYVLEDNAHELFVPPLFRRLATEAGTELNEQVPGPMGGAGRTIAGLRQLLADIRLGVSERPDVIVVGIDADCSRHGERSRQVERACTLERYESMVIVAEPDPHIESWYLADPACVQQLLRIPARPSHPDAGCRKQEHKDRLRSIVRSSGAPTPLGGVEYGPEIVAGMSLYRAGRNAPSLRRFTVEARAWLREVR